jgi:hypothetical protein
VAGVVAGVVGIGGGMLMAPMLLDAGIHPQVRSATPELPCSAECCSPSPAGRAPLGGFAARPCFTWATCILDALGTVSAVSCTPLA